MNILNENDIDDKDLGDRWDLDINKSIQAIRNITNNFKEITFDEINHLIK